MILVRIYDGVLRPGMKIRMMAAGTTHQVEQVGIFTPKANKVDALGAGEVGYITAAIKTVADTHVGDTITEDRRPTARPLPGFKPSLPVVFSGLFPVDTGDYGDLRESLERLHLNDASFHFEPETSAALGLGFRCGFLGLLHLEIIQERLVREFGLDIITTHAQRHLPGPPQRTAPSKRFTIPPTCPIRPGLRASRSPGSRPPS